jgi:hypothetical protein
VDGAGAPHLRHLCQRPVPQLPVWLHQPVSRSRGVRAGACVRAWGIGGGLCPPRVRTSRAARRRRRPPTRTHGPAGTAPSSRRLSRSRTTTSTARGSGWTSSRACRSTT